MTSEPRVAHILFPSDLSAESDRAFAHARLLAERLQARLTLFHALEIPPDRWVRAAGREEELRARVADEARAELAARAAAAAVPHEIVVDTHASNAPALADLAVLRHVREARPDLVVMASHRRGDVESFFLGSVAEEVLRHAGCPVLVVGPRSTAVPRGYRRILVTTDLSEPSRRAFGPTALLADLFEADTLALHVLPRPLLTALADRPQALAAAVPGDERLRAFVGDATGPRTRFRVEQGAPWERIVHVARAEAVDLVVMARDGADGPAERVLGSQTERVIRRAPCPVLAV